MSIDFIVQPTTDISGQLRVPGDKSISHRSVMLGSIAEGLTKVGGFLCGEDALATMNAFQAMGVEIQRDHTNLHIHGVGRLGLQRPSLALDLGNSGTAMRLMMGLLAGQSFDVGLTGDASLRSRPMKRIVDPLSLMGVKFRTNDGKAPLTIENTERQGQALTAIEYALPMASAQVKSAVLLAGLYADGETSVIEPAPTRDHTERMLRGFGYSVETDDGHIRLKGGGTLTATDIDIPADISSAAFFMVAAVIGEKSELKLNHVGVNPSRTGIIKILRAMGADIEILGEREVGGEPVADIIVRGSDLHGIDIPEQWLPSAIDEIPVIAVAAACARGVTRLSGGEELRVKESDRISAIVSMLSSLGVSAQETPDGFVITGRGSEANTPKVFSGGEVNSFDDHRIAMAATIASVRARGNIIVKDCANVSTSFPNYVEMANSVGLKLSFS